MADEYAQNLPDIPERTETAGTDLVLVNSGGSDYKQTKANFLQGDLYHVFDNTSLLTTQIDALPNMGTFFGRIASFGAQSVTGIPVNSNGDVFVQKFNRNYIVVDFHPIGNSDATYRKCKNGGTWESSWTQLPSRSEITALNNSLANIRTSGQFLGYKDKYITNVSISYDNSYASLGDVYNDFGIPSGAYVISFLIRGWSGASGTLMLMAGSDGKTIYLMSNKAGTIGSITVRVWYAMLT